MSHKIRTPFAELDYGVAHQLKLSDIQVAAVVTLHAHHEASEFMRGLHGPNPTEVYWKESSGFEKDRFNAKITARISVTNLSRSPMGCIAQYCPRSECGNVHRCGTWALLPLPESGHISRRRRCKYLHKTPRRSRSQITGQHCGSCLVLRVARKQLYMPLCKTMSTEYSCVVLFLEQRTSNWK